jgi:TIR domain
MQGQLSQRTLGVLRRVLEDMPGYVDTQDGLIRFWKDTLFDFGFAPAVIDVASSYEFKWGEIIPDLFIARFGHQNSNFSNALPPYFCEQTLKRLIAFGLFYSRDIRLGDELKQALADDGFDPKRDQNKDFSVPADVQQKLRSVVSETELEIINIVVDRFLNLHQSTPRKPLVIKFQSTEMLERLARCGVLKTNDQGQHYLPLTLAFHYSGNTVALERAKKSAEITLNVLRNLYEVEPDKPESHFKFPEIEAHARKMYDNLEEGELKFGLYLLQDFSGVLGQYGSSTEGTEVNFVGISEDIVTKDIGSAWDEHIQRRSQFIEREQARKRITSSQQAYLEPMHQQSIKPETVNQKPIIEEIRKETVTEPKKPKILVLISHSSKDVDLAAALIELLRAGLGLLATQIRCSSVDGYRLPAGVDTDAQLRKEVADAGVLVGLLTPNSLASTYVLFELGARWGTQRPMIPLLAGVTPEEMRGPHRVLNALSCSSESQLIQFVEDAGRELKIEPQSSSSYLDKVRSVKTLSDAVETRLVGSAPSQEMVHEESVYWKMKNGKREGPYCPNCYDAEGKEIHLNPGATKGTYGCGTCQNSFRTNEYNPRPARRRPFSSR